MIRVGIEFAHYRPEIDRFSATYLKDINSPIFQKIREKYDFKDNDYFDSLIDKAYEKGGELRDDLPKAFIKI